MRTGRLVPVATGNPDDVPVFSDDQMDRLSGCGLNAPQIARLQEILPVCRALTRRPPPMADVRDELAEVKKVLGKARAALMRLQGPRPEYDDVVEAHARVRNASERHGAEVPEVSAAIEALVDTLEVALQVLPPDERRHRASSEPVRRIHRALWEGWGEVNMQAKDISDPVDFAEHPRDPFPPSASRHETSKFLEVASICYEAFTGAVTSPERAIKAYREEERAFRLAARARAPGHQGG